jgi:hypothetical protein
MAFLAYVLIKFIFEKLLSQVTWDIGIVIADLIVRMVSGNAPA